MITAVSVLYNDEPAMLGRWLDGIRRVADAVVLADNSDDGGRVRLAQMRAAGVRVLERGEWSCEPGVGPVGSARNAAIACADEGWILALDTDETIDPCHREALTRACRSSADGYFMPWLTYEGDDIRVADYKFIFLRTSARPRFSEPIHENVTVSMRRARASADWLDVPIIHRPLPQRRAYKARHYVAGLERAIATQPGSVRLRWFLAASYLHAGRAEDALASLESARRLADQDHPVESLNVHTLYAYLRLLTGDRAAASTAIADFRRLLLARRDDLEMTAYSRTAQPVADAVATAVEGSADLPPVGDVLRCFYCY